MDGRIMKCDKCGRELRYDSTANFYRCGGLHECKVCKGHLVYGIGSGWWCPEKDCENGGKSLPEAPHPEKGPKGKIMKCKDCGSITELREISELRCTNRRTEPEIGAGIESIEQLENAVTPCLRCGAGMRYNTGEKKWECIPCTGAIKAERYPSIDTPDREPPQTDQYLEPMRSELIGMIQDIIEGEVYKSIDVVDTLTVLVEAVIERRQFRNTPLAPKPSFIPLKEYENYSGLRSGDRFNHKGKTFHVVQEATFIPGMRELEVK